MRRIIPPRRPEGIRWLRSDGKPNFGDRIHRKPGDAQLLATRPVYTVTRTTSILEAMELIAEKNIRALPVSHPATKLLEGMTTVMDYVNYLGGGELYNIVVKRYGGNAYKALNDEKVESIMNPNPYYVTVSDRLEKILEIMVTRNVGVLPVVKPDGKIYGIITEHDLVKHLVEKHVGKTVREVMTSNVISINSSATIMEAAKTMIKYSVRRLPVIEDDGSIWGLITAKHIVKFFGSHDAFRFTESPLLEDMMKAPVKLVGTRSYVTVEPDVDVGDAATLMIREGVGCLLVVSEGRVVGIVTERDVLYGLATTG